MENKTAEERLRDLIDKHLEFKSGLETTSIQYYAEYGKVSGSMYLNVKRLCEEYASQQLAEKDKEIERLITEWQNRLEIFREENSHDLKPIEKSKASAKFLTLRDCLKELKQSLNK